MAESIRFAVVHWNRPLHEAQAVVVEETMTVVNGAGVITVRKSTGIVEKLPPNWGTHRVRQFYSRALRMPADAIAVVQVAP